MTGRAMIIGSLTTMAGLALITGWTARFLPSESPVGPLARIFDSLAPGLLLLSALIAVLIIGLRFRRLGLSLLLATGLAMAHLGLEHRALSQEMLPDQPRKARILFLNVLGENAAYADRIVTAALAEDPDVIVFAEAEAVYGSVRRLGETHQVLTPCAFEDCPLIIATRLPVRRSWQLSLNPIWPDRYGVAELESVDGTPFFLSVAHLVKPWFSGVSEAETERLAAQYNWLGGPVVAIGDFNAAPWSRPVMDLLRDTGFRSLRWPSGTWPAGLGRWGIPIDLALVHNGARVTRSQTFGAALNSNHLGFVIDVTF